MGKPDLIIAINEMAFLIKEDNYELRNEAILKAIEKYEKYWCKLKEIKEIKVYELF